MAKHRILVTRKWPAEVERLLAERYEVTLNTTDTPLTGEQLKAAMQNYDAVLPTVTDKLDESVFDSANMTVKILANYGVGFSHIHAESAKRHNIVVSNTPEVLSECTADIAMTLLLSAARRSGEGERLLRAGQWHGWHPTHLMGSKVSGKTLGIIGFGRIGQEMAKRAHFGFDMKILVQNRSQVDGQVLHKFSATQVESVEALLPQCDFVSLHCPGGAENKHLINGNRLSLMPENSFLINTARGEVVDEAALATALEQGTIRGAGLDVFDGEPNINPVFDGLENLVMLPHLGSATTETRVGMGIRALNNLDAFFAGVSPQDRVI